MHRLMNVLMGTDCLTYYHRLTLILECVFFLTFTETHFHVYRLFSLMCRAACSSNSHCKEKCCSQRKLMRKVSHPRAKFNGRLEPSGWPGNDGSTDSGPGVTFIEGGG
jgi:hypothetical protein